MVCIFPPYKFLNRSIGKQGSLAGLHPRRILATYPWNFWIISLPEGRPRYHYSPGPLCMLNHYPSFL